MLFKFVGGIWVRDTVIERPTSSHIALKKCHFSIQKTNIKLNVLCEGKERNVNICEL
jgi:hypothetical protein